MRKQWVECAAIVVLSACGVLAAQSQEPTMCVAVGIAIDRAGLVGGDGATASRASLSPMPTMTRIFPDRSRGMLWTISKTTRMSSPRCSRMRLRMATSAFLLNVGSGTIRTVKSWRLCCCT